ncbi:LacI family transcriptional regulator [Brachybacterium sp. NBEC-018]|uniref:LacI family DNA-binding transcriptional regulator n=1 Tax=Brachybacterium sp. NBEC-018 TaxID=2996004 RepID=UPI00217545CC|nr:LacI family DNA-binding transcriptional regulator [Brachybacterium sp. NBEC-018]UVY82973.1 LacI family transcriptional regulator [Brachybacterium sp. NBEC-018]
MPSPTLADVAREAGVSKGTASKALNGVTGVSAGTRERVAAAAAALGWTPSYAARALSRASTGVFGLALARSSETVGTESFFMAMVAGLEEELALTDRALLIQLVPDVEAESELLARWAAERRVDGVVLLDARFEDPRAAVIEHTGLAAAAMASSPLSPMISRLAVDEDERMDLVLDRLMTAVDDLPAGAGRHLLYLGGLPQFQHVMARERRFRERCGAAGVGASVLHSDYQQHDVSRWTREVLALHREAGSHGVRGVVVDNDLLAAQLLVELGRDGVRVPEDLAIVALEDSILCTVTSPAITALHRDTREAGRLLARLLVRHIEEGTLTEDIGPGGMVVRGSG